MASDRAIRGVVITGRRRPAGWSLRRTLVTSILLLFAIVTLATGLATTYLLRASLEAELDARLVASATRAIGPDGPAQGQDRTLTRGDGRHGPPLSEMLVLVVDGSSIRTNAVTTRRGSTQLTTHQANALAAADLGRQPRTLDLGDDLGSYRLMAGTTPNGEHVITGLPMAPLVDSLQQMRLITLGLALLGFIVVGGGTAWIVGRALRPLERVAATATRVAELPLSSGEVRVVERVPARDTNPRTEVGQVGASLNGLLDHVDTSLVARHESEMQLRRFVADASHELRTPLASIRGYTELSLREPTLPSEVRHALGRVDSEAGRMSSLVEDLLLLARLDAGRPLERTTVDLTRLLLETVSDARAAGPDHRWRLDLPDEAVEVIGDEARLTQVVVNLLANARLHTPAGTTVTSRVRAGTGNTGVGTDVDGVIIEVEDDGPGIDPTLLPTLFQRFTRGDTARTRTGGSTGLGLSIAHAVVVAHHGVITVDSRPGATRFTIVLPADRG